MQTISEDAVHVMFEKLTWKRIVMAFLRTLTNVIFTKYLIGLSTWNHEDM